MPPTHPRLRFGSYNRLAVDPAHKSPRYQRAQAERVRAIAEYFSPLNLIAEEPVPESTRPWPTRFAFYGRIAADLPPHQIHVARDRQYSLCADAVQAVAGTLTASFFDPATASTVPIHLRPGGKALLATRTDFDALATANFTRIGTGTTSLAQAGLPVLLADLNSVIPPDGWDGPLAQILNLGSGA